MAEYHDTGGVILDGPFDPDAQATVTDFIDYTEYLPADLIRSLTLIRGLDKRYLDSAQGVHELTRTYGQLPDLPPESRPDPCLLRRDISAQLDSAINARESAYAEACRLYDVVDRHFNRLDAIKQKLEALPKPESRDATSPIQPLTNAKRPRTSKKGDEAPATTTTRITLRLDGMTSGSQKSRTRRSLIAAEHLAGLHPDSPLASTEHSDAEGDSKATPLEPASEPTAAAGRKEKQNRRSRASAGVTTAHTGGTSMSTSNALALLKPPPDDAKPGSEDLPWLRLTEWEMTKLRKKMKKNAVWQPSEVMIHRELALRGRGWEAYRTAKAQAEANGSEFIDCDDIMNNYIPGLLTRRSEATGEFEGVVETKLSNRGMKLNEAKKLKRENQAREQAALAAAEAEAAKRLGLFGNDGGQTKPGIEEKKTRSKQPSNGPRRSARGREIRSSLRSSTKRRKTGKESPSPSDNVATRATSATAISSTTTTTTTIIVSTASRATLDLSEAHKRPVAASSIPPSTVSAIRSKSGNTPTPPGTRPSSRRRSVPATETTLIVGSGRELRRKSATPARKTPVPDFSRAASVSAPPRRRKRPAPGPVSSGQDGGAAVSYGRRKAKPGKKRVGSRDPASKDGAVGQDIRIDEDGVLEEIDPNEPRYCLCGDVSFGTMICCENQDCDREWFHLDCIGLSEVPSRTAKWYCPDCRVKFNKGTDGIIKSNSSRR
ncbi:hypothetical protein ARAM_005184 [Aspergillus rambellii]|uniref:Chromatin modification-related protein n=1 Tax=Aspergillus rambellii TaxID=308745 RepID=A0A0F8X7N8_9EURO|nr:hypothetical protein ARAM_005184 [Aspergillus rambellii]